MATGGWLGQPQYLVMEGKDGTLGYFDGTKYVALYGRLLPASEVAPVTVTSSREIETRTTIRLGSEHMGVEHVARQRSRIDQQTTVDNILFRYEETQGIEGRYEVVYAQEEWQRGYGVRRLFAAALCGRGAMLASIKNRAYVLGSSIPHVDQWVGRGYLKIDGSEHLEHFLNEIGWASRCKGVRQMRADTGDLVDTFVIKDRNCTPTAGYYVVCTRSRATYRLICHLEPIGRTKDMLRKVVPHSGDSELGSWARRFHEGAHSFLFD